MRPARFASMPMPALLSFSAANIGCGCRDQDGVLCRGREREMALQRSDRSCQSRRQGRADSAIDLGLKDLATLSDGRKIEMPAFYRRYEAQLALAQKHGQKRRTTALHAKVKNCRQHFLHENATQLQREHGRIRDVNATATAR
jgi:hypothetical protein